MFLTNKRGNTVAPPYIYFMACNGYVKIGLASNPLKRLYTVQVNNPHEVYFLGVVKGGKAEELAYHVMFEQDFVRGEWFRHSTRIKHVLASLEDEMLVVPAKVSTRVSRQRRIETRRSKHISGGIPVATASPERVHKTTEVKSA